jgi:hypothetical protein
MAPNADRNCSRRSLHRHSRVGTADLVEPLSCQKIGMRKSDGHNISFARKYQRWVWWSGRKGARLGLGRVGHFTKFGTGGGV